MYLLFLDESGIPGEDGIFALGGVAIRADQWAEVKDRFETCLEEAGWPADKEFKWSEISRSTAAADAAYPVYDCLATLPIHCLVTVLYTEGDDPVNREKFFANPDLIYRTAFTFVAERYQRFLAHHDSHGVIVLDSRQYETDDRLRRYFDRIHNEGTDFAELDRSHWIITDGEGNVQEVKGDGVVGAQPTLKPGQSIEYTSGCALRTPRGTMHGTYQMVREDGERFDAQVGPFALAMPHALN